MASNGSNQGDSGIEAVTTPSSGLFALFLEFMFIDFKIKNCISVHDQSIRPSSTTSRESEADAVTSGYFRYNL